MQQAAGQGRPENYRFVGSFMATLDEILAAQRDWDLARRTGDLAAAGRARTSVLIDGIRILAGRLEGIGFPVSPVITQPFVDVDNRIERLTKGTGVSPPEILALIWRSVGAIALTDLQNCSHDAFWARHGMGRTQSDGFHICGCDDPYIEAMLWVAENASDSNAPEPFCYCFSPDIHEKDNCSGGGGYLLAADSDWAPTCIGVRWPQPSATRTATNDPMDLLTYARTAILECGGFPGFMGKRNFEPIRVLLTRDLPVF
jgi:hypothetical protein